MSITIRMLIYGIFIQKICYSSENETKTTYNNMDESHRHNVKQKKPIIKECIMSYFIYMNFTRGKTNLW